MKKYSKLPKTRENLARLERARQKHEALGGWPSDVGGCDEALLREWILQKSAAYNEWQLLCRAIYDLH